MPSDDYALLQRLRTGRFENCVIVTYNADLVFYEQVVLPILRSRGCYNNLVVMDLQQYSRSLDFARGEIRRLGHQYTVWPVAMPGAFHPKLILLTAEKQGKLVLGSGNLTVRGYSSNWEVFSEVARAAKENDEDHLFRSVWDFVRSVSHEARGGPKRQLRQLKDTTPWLAMDTEETAWPRLLMSHPDGPSICEQVRSAIPERRVASLTVVAPFFDRRLQGLAALREALQPRKIRLAIQPASVSISGKVAAQVPGLITHAFSVSDRTKSTNAYLHAKVYIVQTADAEYCLWGSPNCSVAALAAPAMGRNAEIALLARGRKGYFQSRLGLRLDAGTTIDPKTLAWSGSEREKELAVPRLVSVDVDAEGTLEALLHASGGRNRFSDGQLVLHGENPGAPQLAVKCVGDNVFRGRWTAPLPLSTLLCHLESGRGKNRICSTTAAVCFHQALSSETPSKRAAGVRKIVEEINAGSSEWAKSVGFFEVFFRIEERDAGATGVTRSAGAGRKTREAEDDEEGELVEYEEFLADATPARGGPGALAQKSNDLLDTIRAVQLILARGVGQDEAEEEDPDRAKYDEEIGRNSAEGDGADIQDQLIGRDAEEIAAFHKHVRNSYLRLMRRAAERYDWIRDHAEQVTSDELLRLHLVVLLVLRAVGRRIPGAESNGPILRAENLATGLLPPVAIMLGRVRSGRGTKAGPRGPILSWLDADPSDPHVRKAVLAACLLLAGLTLERQSREARGWLSDEETDPRNWQFYPELVALRSFAAMQRASLLPTREELEGELATGSSESQWLSSLERPQLLDTFDNLTDKAQKVLRIESRKPSGRAAAENANPIKVGAWVYSDKTGVTQATEVSGVHIELALVGEPDTDDDWFMKVSPDYVTPVDL